MINMEQIDITCITLDSVQPSLRWHFPCTFPQVFAKDGRRDGKLVSHISGNEIVNDKVLHITTLTLADLPTLIFKGQETITVEHVNTGLSLIYCCNTFGRPRSSDFGFVDSQEQADEPSDILTSTPASPTIPLHQHRVLRRKPPKIHNTSDDEEERAGRALSSEDSDSGGSWLLGSESESESDSGTDPYVPTDIGKKRKKKTKKNSQHDSQHNSLLGQNDSLREYALKFKTAMKTIDDNIEKSSKAKKKILLFLVPPQLRK